ncbi:MAG: nucleotidyltransferase domain-containing protein [Nanoarchaeota archaeon]|nr:nucleotidyltransferase domain-containing protein [Nanoarchaeota archaeon]
MRKGLLRLRDLSPTAKQFASKHKDVWDIAVYGSFARGNELARDIDIAVILKNETGAERRLSIAHELKEAFEPQLQPFQPEVRAVTIGDFVDTNFLARQGILAEGCLLLRKTQLSGLLGFKSYVFIKYSLKGLTYSQKKMLYYALHGRRGMAGILKSIGGESVSRELLRVPVGASSQIEHLFSSHKISFTMEFVMSYKKR